MCIEGLSRDSHGEETTRLLLHLPRTVVIIGMMGVGKTVIGQRLAARLHVPFFDSDAAVEALSGCTVCDFFALYGEKAFRERERQIVIHLLSQQICVISLGGGAFMDPQIRAVIKAQAVSVWLKANLDILVSRTTGRMYSPRPLLLQGNPRTVLNFLLKERSPIYATADISIDSTDGSCERIVECVATALAKHFDSVKAAS